MLKGTARVQVTVEVYAGVWGADCTVDQIHKQASRDAVEKVKNLVNSISARVVGEPKVTAIIVDE